MEVASYLRAHQARALLESSAIFRLIEAFDDLIAEAERTAEHDAIAEHCVVSWRRRRDALYAEYQALDP